MAKNIYNQNTYNDFPGDCTIFSMTQIIGEQYGVWLKYSTVNKLVDYFSRAGILMRWGASFSKIYPAMEKLMEEQTGLGITTKKVLINTKSFENYLNKGYSFGIGLKYGNKTYLEAVERGILTKQDIDIIAEEKGGFGHNNVYSNGKITEIYKGKELRVSLSVLRHGCNKGVFYYPARTFLLDDKLIEKWLFAFKNKDPLIHKDVSRLTTKEFKAMERASKLRAFRK